VVEVAVEPADCEVVQHRAHPRKAEGVVYADLISADGEFR